MRYGRGRGEHLIRSSSLCMSNSKGVDGFFGILNVGGVYFVQFLPPTLKEPWPLLPTVLSGKL
jgi:hypothetical protein